MIEWIIAIAFLAGAVLAGTCACMLKWRRIRAKETEQTHARAKEAREKILADGKIEGPKGHFKPRRWGRKWVEYSNAIPPPRAESKAFPRIRELPNYPHAGPEG